MNKPNETIIAPVDKNDLKYQFFDTLKRICFYIALLLCLCSIISFLIYISGNVNNLSDDALINAVQGSAFLAIGSIVFLVICFIFWLIFSVLYKKIKPINIIVSILLFCVNIAILLATSIILSMFNGLSTI